MVKKKVDPRVRGLIVDGVRKNHRSLFILVGDYGKDQVENLHKILSKTRVKARPSVLWCYKKELGFSTHRKKRIQEIKRDQARGIYDPERDDPFELFISSTNIRWTYYKETDKILGQTFGMVVLQDFEALTPNILARTIETVEGGGLVIILLKTVKSLKQLYSMSMDVHSRFRTEAHHEIVPRFNERFILSLTECRGCLVLDDELNILPISSNTASIPCSSGGLIEDGEGLSEGDADLSGVKIDPELVELKASLEQTPNAGVLVGLTKTLDQAKAVISFLDAIAEKTLRSTIALTAARGRGKSAAIGLCLSGAVAYGYSNIFVTAPSPENLITVFEFIISGLKALKYNEHLDFEILHENIQDIGKVVVRINIFKGHRQTIQYIAPSDHAKLAQAELVAIDEAAAIPLPTVKKLMGPYLVFLSSTINGYEGTGRSLSLKLIQQLRQAQGAAAAAAASEAASAVAGAKSNKAARQVHEERWKVAADTAANYSSSRGARILTELKLETPIRYGKEDPVEKWLNNLLCLDVASHSTRMVSVMPAPHDCDLYIVDRDALFSYHSLSESLLQRIWALYTAAHYKNSPNDLQMLSDAPAHRLFVLLGPQTSSSSSGLPDILCVVQVAFEGFISQKSVQSEMLKSNKASGDMIPWTVSQQFNDNEFASLSGARIVRIATHPDVQSMGYGSRAIDLLVKYFNGDLSAKLLPSVGVFGGEGSDKIIHSNLNQENGEASLQDEIVKPRKKLPPLLTPLTDRSAERLHWLGVSFGLTTPLLGFWARHGFQVCYVRQTPNELTGEHSCIVLKELHTVNEISPNSGAPSDGWLDSFVTDYRRRMVSLMSYSFSKFESVLALSLLDPEKSLTAASNQSEDAPSAPTGTLVPSSSSVNFNLNSPLSAAELLSVHMSYHDLKRLELYERNMVDHHMILDLLPGLSSFVFNHRLAIRFSFLQITILLAVGLQHRSVDDISAELNLPVSQVLAFFNKTIRKLASTLRAMVESYTVATEMKPTTTRLSSVMERAAASMTAYSTSLQEDQSADEELFRQQQKQLLLAHNDVSKHAIKAADEALGAALKKTMIMQPQGGSKVVSVPKTNASQAAPTKSASVSSLPPLSADDFENDEPENDQTIDMSTLSKSARKKLKKRLRESTSGEDIGTSVEVSLNKTSENKKLRK